MDDQATECRPGALRSERAPATAFSCPDVGPGAIAMTATAVVQRLTGRADIAIVFRVLGETLGRQEMDFKEHSMYAAIEQLRSIVEVVKKFGRL